MLSIKGDRKAQMELYHSYSNAMFNVCFRMLKNREQAEDILQDAFLEVFDKLHFFRGEATLGAWIKQIVVNKCINSLKKKKLDFEFLESMECVVVPQENDENDYPELTVKRIMMCLNLLPEGSRLVFSLFLLEGYDHSEISQILGITESTSKTQLLRAKQKIKELLHNYQENGKG